MAHRLILNVHTYIHTFILSYIHDHSCIYIYTYMCTYMYLNTHVYIYILYIYIYIYGTYILTEKYIYMRGGSDIGTNILTEKCNGEIFEGG